MFRLLLYFFLVVSLPVFYTACTDAGDSAHGKKIDSLSVDEITKRLRDEPDNADLYFARAKKYQALTMIDQAIADLNSAITKSGREEFYLLIADLYLIKAQSQNSKDMLERCLKKYPKNIDAMIKLAQLHFYVKQYKESMEYLKEAQEINQNIPQIYFIRGLVLEESGDTANAIINFQISTEKKPDYYEAYIILGLRFADRKDSVALDYYRNALRIKPKSIEAMYNTAMFYQNNKQLNKAMSVYEEIVTKIDSSHKYSYFNMGYISLEHFHDYGKAISLFTRAAQSDQEYIDAFYNIGVCYERLKDKKKASEFYKKALSVNSDYVLAKNGLLRVGK